MLEKKPVPRKLPPLGRFVLENFPFIADDSDALTVTDKLDYLVRYVDAMGKFVNDVIESEVVKYIDRRFNDMMVDAIYDEPTETLILTLTEGENHV